LRALAALPLDASMQLLWYRAAGGRPHQTSHSVLQSESYSWTTGSRPEIRAHILGQSFLKVNMRGSHRSEALFPRLEQHLKESPVSVKGGVLRRRSMGSLQGWETPGAAPGHCQAFKGNHCPLHGPQLLALCAAPLWLRKSHQIMFLA
jgi:hypothetical protein